MYVIVVEFRCFEFLWEKKIGLINWVWRITFGLSYWGVRKIEGFKSCDFIVFIKR